jgi:hypothetical protein
LLLHPLRFGGVAVFWCGVDENFWWKIDYKRLTDGKSESFDCCSHPSHEARESNNVNGGYYRMV